MPERRVRGGGLAVLAVLAAAPAAGAAQLTANMDAGWASVHYEGYLRSTVLTLTPTLRLENPLSAVVARGTLSFFESGSRSGDIVLAGSAFTRPLGALRAEVSGSGGGTLYNGIGTGHVSASARLHIIRDNAGVWLGGGGGYVDDGILGATLYRAGIGSWLRLSGLSVTASVNHVGTAGVRVTDIEGGAGLLRGPLELWIGGGVRAGGSELTGAMRWGDVTGAIWLSRNVAFVAAHGRYPSEPAHGTPGGAYTALALRVATGRPILEPASTRTPRYNVPSIAYPVAAAFEVRSRTGDLRVLRIRAPGARRVEIAGDFNNWVPQQLQRDGEWFAGKFHVAPGSHKFNIRVDAGEWGVPPGVPLVRDEFGAVVALLIITAP